MQEMARAKESALNLNFAELVKEPEVTMRKVCDFIEAEYEAKMLTGPQFNRVYPHDKVLSAKSTQ